VVRGGDEPDQKSLHFTHHLLICWASPENPRIQAPPASSITVVTDQWYSKSEKLKLNVFKKKEIFQSW